MECYGLLMFLRELRGGFTGVSYAEVSLNDMINPPPLLCTICFDIATD